MYFQIKACISGEHLRNSKISKKDMKNIKSEMIYFCMKQISFELDFGTLSIVIFFYVKMPVTQVFSQVFTN